jgi:hypothetical protein
MSHDISALAQSFIIYLIIGVSYFGWGHVTKRTLGISERTSRSDISVLWLGWALTLLLFQILHFFCPLTAYAVVPIYLVGVAFSVPQLANVLCHPPHSRLTLRKTIGIVTALILAFWIASRSMLPPTNYDSGLYHFNAIRWINSFRLVPGLGNLHDRLAFNQSFFTYAATLNFHPFFNHGRSIANSFLLLLSIATCVQFLRPILKEFSVIVESHPFTYLPSLFTLPILGFLALSSNGLASPTPDLTSSLLQLVMFILFAHGIAAWGTYGGDQNYRAMLLAILAVTSVTIKLSNLAFSAVMIGFVLAYVWKHNMKRVTARTALLCTTIIAIWCVRGIVLSGAPLFPATIGYVPLDWAMPRKNITNTANWVFSWARQPGVNWRAVLGNWHWFKPWVLRISKDVTTVVFPLRMSALFFILTVMLCLLKKKCRPHFFEVAILLPSVIGLLYWFFTAPNPRFANALFFITLISFGLLLLSSVWLPSRRRTAYMVTCLVFLASNLNIASYVVKHKWAVKSISFSGFHPVKKVPLVRRVTLSGLVVYTPKTGDQCWDSPLPSTPYFNPRLRLRNPKSMASGFTVETGQQE